MSGQYRSGLLIGQSERDATLRTAEDWSGRAAAFFKNTTPDRECADTKAQSAVSRTKSVRIADGSNSFDAQCTSTNSLELR